MNGDGRADIVGFGQSGVFVSLASASGTGAFSDPTFVLSNFGQASGWATQDGYARVLGDVNGDGMADIVGFGQAGVWVSLATGSGNFANPAFGLANFGQASGWSSDDLFHRELGDINGDGKADIVGFGQAGVWAAYIAWRHELCRAEAAAEQLWPIHRVDEPGRLRTARR